MARRKMLLEMPYRARRSWATADDGPRRARNVFEPLAVGGGGSLQLTQGQCVARPTHRRMEVMEALHTRRSIPKLTGDVASDDVRVLVEAAILAPNHHNTEPWRFTVLRGAARARLGAAWAAVQAPRIALDGADRDAFLKREAEKPLRAPVIIVVSTRTDADATVAAEDFAATSAAVENLLLAAHARGLGAMWRTGAMAYEPDVKQHLGLALTDRIVAFVYVGWPAQSRVPERARNLEAVLRVLE